MNVKPRRRKKRKGGGFSWSSYWTQQYRNVYDAMTTKPSDADALNQAYMMKQLVDGGYIDKAEFIDIFFVHDGAQNINWANPGTFDPSPVNAPVFTPYVGYKGAKTGTKYVRSNFNPTTNGTKVSQNNICAIVGVVDDDAADDYDFGAASGSTIYFLLQRKTNTGQFFCNTGTGDTIAGVVLSGAHVGMSRGAAGSFSAMQNVTVAAKTRNSTGLVNNELYICGWNNKGTATVTNKTIAYAAVFTALTETEMRGFVEIMETYMRSNSKTIINHSIAYPKAGTKRLLSLPTSVADNNETIHPSVIAFPTAWNGYKYWMANTPYPVGVSPNIHENPEIYVSNDLVTWTAPAGLTNPLFPVPASNLYSDVALFYESGTLYLFYRTTEDAGVSKIKVIKSTDGITWNTSTPATVQSQATTGLILTPSFVKVGDTYYMYYVKSELGTVNCGRMACSTIDGTYATEEEVAWAFILPNHIECHYNVDEELFYMAIASSQQNGGIWLGTSEDGLTFTREIDASPNIYATLAEELPHNFYKPSFMKDGTKWYMFYSKHEPDHNYTLIQEIVLV